MLLLAFLLSASCYATEVVVGEAGVNLMQMSMPHKGKSRAPAAGDLPKSNGGHGASLGQIGQAGQGQEEFIGSCFTTYYGATLICAIIVLLILLIDDILRRKQITAQGHRIRALRLKLRADKNILKADEKELKLLCDKLRGDQQRDYEAIINGGRVEFDFNTKYLKIKKSIDFLDDTDQFSNPLQARSILADVADLLRILRSTCLLIEGHTNTPLDELDEFAHELAFARAEAVKFTLVGYGIDELRLDAIGLPGALGKNEHRVEMRIVRV